MTAEQHGRDRDMSQDISQDHDMQALPPGAYHSIHNTPTYPLSLAQQAGAATRCLSQHT